MQIYFILNKLSSFYIFNVLALYKFRFFHAVYDVTPLLSAKTFPYIPGILNVASSATRRAAAGIILHLFIFISLSGQFSYNMLVSCVIQRCQEYFREIVVESFIRKTSMSRYIIIVYLPTSLSFLTYWYQDILRPTEYPQKNMKSGQAVTEKFSYKLCDKRIS